MISEDENGENCDLKDGQKSVQEKHSMIAALWMRHDG